MRQFILLSLLAISAGICSAKSSSQEKALLWQISGNGLEKPSYLFGTIHLICAEELVWPEQMKASLQKSDKICFELDLDDPAIHTEMTSGLMDTTGGGLKEQLSAAQYERLRQYLKDSLRMDIKFFENMSPAALSSVLLLRVLSCGMPVSYEMKIQEEVRNSNKEIIGLEEVSEQMAVLDSVLGSNSGSELMELVDSLPQLRTEYGKMVSAYKKQNLEQLCSWMKNAELPWESSDVLLDQRNRKWIPSMQSHMKKGSVFFAVGAAHLCGEPGLISLLRKAGYTVSPLR